MEGTPGEVSFVYARVESVSQKFLRLVAPDQIGNNHVQLSSVFALSALPRPEGLISNLVDEFRVGDTFLLDVRFDGEFYLPQQIRSIQKYRDGVLELVADGLLVNVDQPMPAIRNIFVPDINCRMDRFVNGNQPVVVGAQVTFEARQINDHEFEGLAVHVNSPDSNGIAFPFYESEGVVSMNPDRQIVVRCRSDNGDFCSYPVYHGAYYGCGIPIACLIKEKIVCLICPSEPYMQNSSFEVIYFEPKADAAVPLEERADPAENDGFKSVGDSIITRTSFRYVQASRYYNEKIEKKLQDAFLFVAERAEPARFRCLLSKYPKYVAGMIKLCGLNIRPLPATTNEATGGGYERFVQRLASYEPRGSGDGHDAGSNSGRDQDIIQGEATSTGINISGSGGYQDFIQDMATAMGTDGAGGGSYEDFIQSLLTGGGIGSLDVGNHSAAAAVSSTNPNRDIMAEAIASLDTIIVDRSAPITSSLGGNEFRPTPSYSVSGSVSWDSGDTNTVDSTPVVVLRREEKPPAWAKMTSETSDRNGPSSSSERAGLRCVTAQLSAIGEQSAIKPVSRTRIGDWDEELVPPGRGRSRGYQPFNGNKKIGKGKPG